MNIDLLKDNNLSNEYTLIIFYNRLLFRILLEQTLGNGIYIKNVKFQYENPIIQSLRYILPKVYSEEKLPIIILESDEEKEEPDLLRKIKLEFNEGGYIFYDGFLSDSEREESDNVWRILPYLNSDQIKDEISNENRSEINYHNK